MPTVEVLKNLPDLVGDTGRICFNDSESDIPSHPIVLTNDNGEHWIRVDDCAFGKTTKLKEAVMAAAFCFNIFNIEVPENLVGFVQIFNL